MRRTLALAFSVAVVAGFALAANLRADSDKMSPADQKFVRETNQINLLEIRVGTVAQKATTNEAVRKFAEKLVEDHTRMNEALLAMAQKKSINLPKDLDSREKEKADKLARLKGAEFDRMFAREMVDGHEKAIEKFETEIKNGQDMDVKAFAEKYVVVLREHLQEARALMTTAK